MPPLPPAAGVLKVVLHGISSNQNWAAVLHTTYTGPAPTTAQLDTYANGVVGAYTGSLQPLMHANVILGAVEVDDLTSQTSAFTKITANVAGTRAGAPLTRSVCCVASWTVHLRYRGGHCRTYFPVGVQTDAADVANWTTTAQTAFRNGYAGFRTAMNGLLLNAQPVPMCMLSYYSNHVLRPTPLKPLIEGVRVGLRMDTQRRRLGKETGLI